MGQDGGNMGGGVSAERESEGGLLRFRAWEEG